MKRLLSLAGLVLASGLSFGQSTVVTPSALNGVEGAGFYIYSGPITFQQVMAPSQLVGLPSGAVITGMQLRLDSTWGASDASTVPNFDVYLGPSNFPPGSLSDSVAGNQGPGTVQVRSGSLTFPQNSFTFGNSPNAFGPVITFSSFYVYTGGDLLVTVSHSTPSAELDFDVGLNITGSQVKQSQAYNSGTHTDDAPDTGIAIQFVFAVPEPAFYYTCGIAAMGIGGVLWWRRKRPDPEISVAE